MITGRSIIHIFNCCRRRRAFFGRLAVVNWWFNHHLNLAIPWQIWQSRAIADDLYDLQFSSRIQRLDIFFFESKFLKFCENLILFFLVFNTNSVLLHGKFTCFWHNINNTLKAVLSSVSKVSHTSYIVLPIQWHWILDDFNIKFQYC